jgi:hypothetical protein
LDWISARSWLSVVTGVVPPLPLGGGVVPPLPVGGGVVPPLPVGGGIAPPPDPPPPPPQPAISSIVNVRLATCIDLVMSVSLFDPRLPVTPARGHKVNGAANQVMSRR